MNSIDVLLKYESALKMAGFETFGEQLWLDFSDNSFKMDLGPFGVAFLTKTDDGWYISVPNFFGGFVKLNVKGNKNSDAFKSALDFIADMLENYTTYVKFVNALQQNMAKGNFHDPNE